MRVPRLRLCLLLLLLLLAVGCARAAPGESRLVDLSHAFDADTGELLGNFAFGDGGLLDGPTKLNLYYPQDRTTVNLQVNNVAPSLTVT